MRSAQEISNIHNISPAVEKRLALMSDNQIIERIWNHDHTVWHPDPDEITNRLGWLDVANRMRGEITCINEFVDDVKSSGYEAVLLLGMGGSSLAPEVFSKTFINEPGLDLSILDCTDPGRVRDKAEEIDPQKTLFIVSTKSGGTVETLSFFKYFYNLTQKTVGADSVGDHFIAITDPGSKLEAIANELSFRKTFINDPNIGGRYSALSFFGLVPAALAGVNLQKLLKRTLAAEETCSPSIQPIGMNLGAYLGAVMGEAGLTGRDKVTFVLDERISSFGDWVEQLIAESMGKDDKGILPVVGESIFGPENYADDRLFIQINLGGIKTDEKKLSALESAGHPLISLNFVDEYDLGILMFLFEFATAIAGYVYGIQPFDQPDVEAAKILAREAVAEYEKAGKLPELHATLEDKGVEVYDETKAKTPAEALKEFLNQVSDGDYVAIQAYINPTGASESALNDLRLAIRDRFKIATTLGFGPRFLHSTGQLHKGDRGNGLFIQFTADMPDDQLIPANPGEDGSIMSFGVLKTAQAMGDAQALLNRDRRLIRIKLTEDIPGDVNTLLKAFTDGTVKDFK